MSLTLTADMSGVNQLLRGCEQFLAPNTRRRYLGAVIALGQQSTQLSFIDKRSPSGKPWDPWSPVTLIIKHNRAKHGHSIGELMRDTNRLMNSPGRGEVSGGLPSPGAPLEGELSVTESEAYLIDNVGYGLKHQFGDEGGDPVTFRVGSYTYRRRARSSLRGRRSYKGGVVTVKEHEVNTKTRRIPPREWFGFRPDDPDKAEQILSGLLDEAMSGIGGSPQGGY